MMLPITRAVDWGRPSRDDEMADTGAGVASGRPANWVMTPPSVVRLKFFGNVVDWGMPRTGRPKAELILTEQEREQLLRWSRRAKSSQALALRSRIVLRCAEGADNNTVAARLGCSANTVSKWRRRFVEHRLDGLVDEDRPGRPPLISADQIEDVVVATLESTPKNATHWSRSKMAERTGLSKSTIGRIWRSFELKPHRADGFKLSNDPLFIEKVYDIVGLYLNPPDAAVVLSVRSR